MTKQEYLSAIRGKIRKDSAHSLDNGVIYLKGGDFEEVQSFHYESNRIRFLGRI